MGSLMSTLGSAAVGMGENFAKSLKGDPLKKKSAEDEQAQNYDVSHPPSQLQWKPSGQLPSYNQGGDVPKDQIANVDQGERVLNPEEAHAYRAAAKGDAPPTMLGRIADRAHQIMDNSESSIPGMLIQGNIDLANRPIVKNSDGSVSSEYSTSFGDDKGREVLVPTMVNGRFLTPKGIKPEPGSSEEKEMFKRAQQHYEETGEHMGIFDSPKNADIYAESAHNRDLNTQNQSHKPQYMVKQNKSIQRPVPGALGILPSYDDGGDVPEDQIAKVHEDEHVLTPEKADAYRQAESEVMNNMPLGHGGVPERMSNRDRANAPMGGQMDTEAPKPDYHLQGTKMDTQNAPLGKPKMNMDNGKRVFDANMPAQEASTGKPSPMVPLPAIETPLQSGATDNPDAPQSGNKVVDAGDPAAGYPVGKGKPAPEEIVKQDKMDAMKSGDLVKLGMANINERMLKVGAGAPEGQVSLPTPTAPSARENVVNQENELKQKMINAPTEQERFQAEKDLAELKRKTPWGSEGSSHPGALGKIGHTLASIGQGAAMGVVPYVLPSIPGSQANIAASEARGEQGVEQAQKKESTEAQTAIAQGKPELQQEAQRITEAKNKMANEAALRKQGYTTGPDGRPVPLSYEEMSAHEQGVYDLNQAKANAQNSIAELKAAQADPKSPQNQAIIAKAKAEGMKLDLAGQKLGLDVNKYKADYLGLGPDNEPLPGVQKTEEGKAIGPKISKAEQATQTTTAQRLNKADLSQNVQLNVANASKLIDEHPDLFGKVSGRFTNVKEMIGTDDPAIVQLGIQVHNMAVASAGIHGQRGQSAVEAYEKDILNHFRNSPEATKAALNELSGSVQTFIDAAKSGKTVAPTPKTPEEVKTGIPKDATHVYKNKDGKVVGYAEGGKFHELK